MVPVRKSALLIASKVAGGADFLETVPIPGQLISSFPGAKQYCALAHLLPVIGRSPGQIRDNSCVPNALSAIEGHAVKVPEMVLLGRILAQNESAQTYQPCHAVGGSEATNEWVVSNVPQEPRYLLARTHLPTSALGRAMEAKDGARIVPDPSQSNLSLR